MGAIMTFYKMLWNNTNRIYKVIWKYIKITKKPTKITSTHKPWYQKEHINVILFNLFKHITERFHIYYSEMKDVL